MPTQTIIPKIKGLDKAQKLVDEAQFHLNQFVKKVSLLEKTVSGFEVIIPRKNEGRDKIKKQISKLKIENKAIKKENVKAKKSLRK